MVRAAVLLAAQLRCAIELVAAPAGAADVPAGAGVVHEFELVDALTGEALTDVGALTPTAFRGDVALPSERVDGVDGVPRRRVELPPTGRYTLRVDGDVSRRYFGCEAELPAAGEGVRRVRVALIPRARDLAVSVDIVRDSARASLPPSTLQRVELRASAAAELDLEVHRGTCAGEATEQGTAWCVRSLSASPGRAAVAVRVPGYGVVEAPVDFRATERQIPVPARFEGHLLSAATLRFHAVVPVLNGATPGGALALDVWGASPTGAMTCPRGETCLRPLVHLEGGVVGYRRGTEFLGPGAQVADDGDVTGTYGWFAAGAGLAVVPAGLDDRLRLSASASLALAARGDEHRAQGTLLSAATAAPGLGGELTGAWRFAGAWQVQAGVRGAWFPAFGARGRRFSYLGGASTSTEAASLVQLSLHVGLGVEL